MSNDDTARAWVEVSLGSLRENFHAIRRAAGDRAAVIPMVKADGYGLGMVRVARALQDAGPWAFGVAAVREGVELRHAGIALPILVFTPIPPAEVDVAARAGLTATISDVEGLARWAAAAAREGRPLDFHAEIDTGMGRAGFDWRDTPRWSASVREAAGSLARWTGVYTHFHGADSLDPLPTQAQWARFQDALAQLPVSREDLMVHACNSAAALRFPGYAADAVRPGIFLYGGRPVEAGVAGVPLPARVASVRARLVLVREVPPNSSVGYGATHISQRWERWGTLAIGYGDGLPRALGNRGFAIVRGRRVPIRGRISMDMTVVDLTDVPDASAGDIATLIGGDGTETITLEEVAESVGTISYEILTGLTGRLPRVDVP